MSDGDTESTDLTSDDEFYPAPPRRISRDNGHPAVALDIPGAVAAHHFDSEWFQPQRENIISIALDEHTHSEAGAPDAFAFGSSLPSYFSSGTFGASPAGHGLGHMMRSGNSSRSRLVRRHSTSERQMQAALPSHDELHELFPPSSNSNSASPDRPSNQQRQQTDSNWTRQDTNVAAAVDKQQGFSPVGSTGLVNDDSLAAPLLDPEQQNDTDNNNIPRLRRDPTIPLAFGKSSLSDAIVFGVINAVAGIPALVAYAAIVFKHPLFAPHLDLLCKFFFISSALHQVVFCLFSTLPFAVGQVQDVGLIFLSAMGTSIATLTIDAGLESDVAVGTALLTMTVSTFFVGLGTWFVARKHMAGFVQYIPLPVIGGYLGFVGYFCLASGIALGSSIQIDTIASWAGLFTQDALVKMVPTVLSCTAMILTLEKISHPLALPSVLVCLVLIFHIVLAVGGISLADAEASGWVLKPSENKENFWELWKLYNIHSWKLDGIYIGAAIRQFAKALGLLLVVVFGSCMDIAAIQQDVPQKLDFDRELATVAISNMATGITGVGFTGSYIFSQTIFTMRAGVLNRANGWVVAALEAAIFIYPYSVVQYLPNYFLGALLVWFGVEISRDWLILSVFKLTRVEYGLLWLTFGSIMQWGLEGGIAAGILCATVYFAYAYALSQQEGFHLVAARSNVVRNTQQQAALEAFLPTHVLVARLQGFIFFGSAQSTGEKLQEAATRLAVGTNVMSTLGEVYSGPKHDQARKALAHAPMYLVIDFSKVTGFDATGARTISMVFRNLNQLGITPIVTACMHHGIPALLDAHGVAFTALKWPPRLLPTPATTTDGDLTTATRQQLAPLSSHDGHSEQEEEESDGDEVRALQFATLEEGLRYCEDMFISLSVQHGLAKPVTAGISLQDLIKQHVGQIPLVGMDSVEDTAALLQRYLTRRTVYLGEVLWRVGDTANEMFLVEKGIIRVDQFDSSNASNRVSEEEEYSRRSSLDIYTDATNNNTTSTKQHLRSFELGAGCVAGSSDFFLTRPHNTRAVCCSHTCRVFRLSKTAMQKMALEVPGALNVLQLIIMRANTSDLSAAANVGLYN